MKKLVIGLLAHVDAGKTTLAESLLYTSGTIRNQGRVDHKDAYLDTDSMERDRGITIFSKQARMQWKNMDVTLMDTPGHVDFSSEMERTLSVIDIAVLVISGSEGVQGHTRTLWKLLEHYGVPTVLFVNKMDQPDTDKKKLMGQLQGGLSKNCVDMTDDKEVVFENISACDEQLIEEYLETEGLEIDSISEAIADRKIFPVWFGSALHNEGTEALLDGIDEYAPVQEYGEEFAARVFKITRDEHGKRLTHLKVTGGVLTPKMIIGEGDSAEKVDQLRIYSGVKFEAVNSASAGEVLAITGLNTTYAGQALGAEEGRVLPVLEPVLSYKLEFVRGTDTQLVYGKIKPLEEEFPELRLMWNEQHKEIHVSVNGEVQTQVLKQVMKDRFDIEVGFGAGSIVYKETIGAPAYGIGHFEPLRHYAEVQLLVEPGEPGSGIEFVSACGVDVLDKNWQRLIKTHVDEAVHPGVLTRSEMTDIRVVLVTGRAHPKHTEGGDFRQATYRALRNAFRQAMNAGKAVLLEPVYIFTMELPTIYIGRAMTDIEKLHGKAQPPEMSEDGEISVLQGIAPVSTFWEYQKELQAYTGGRGQLSCILQGYMPCHNQDEVVEKRDYYPDDDFRRPTGSVFCAHGAGFQVPWDEVAAYAHMPCPISSGQAAGIIGLSGELGVSAVFEDADIAANVRAGSRIKESQTGSHEEKFISLEEIDAIFSSQHRNRKADAAANRRIYKRKHYDIHDYNKGAHSGNGASGGGYGNGAGNTNGAGNSNSNGKGKVGSSALPKCLLVDGYNMIHSWEELKPMVDSNMDGARGRLIDICSEYQGIVGGEVIVVFDAYLVSGNMGSVTKQGGIYVVYTKEAETADQYIEQATKRKARDYRVTVATSDMIEQLIVWGEGALRMSAPEFEAEIERARKALRNDYLDKHNRLGNVLPLDKISNELI
ncbi:MAG: TetM/TetW/TetO/TetS family tetracycline resistance ribosomal protection protein [Lachnospiraceae bacterium]|nr:TetM/TetW/TetO/TetS family tetracycline resistance ribosomal protection protein [Lachnospiraceae bacterium]